MKKLLVLALAFGALVSCTPVTPTTEVPTTDSVAPVDTVVVVDTTAVIVITNESATDTVSE